jgi:hypothetical protein
MCWRTRRPCSANSRSRAAVLAGLVRFQIGAERHLRVHHHALPAGQAHDQVRPQPAVVARHRGLLDEVAVRDHVGQLDDAPELHLAPAPAHAGGAHRAGKIRGLRL